jgi:hypothetical protein
MSAEVFAASRGFSALLGGLLAAAGAPADEALAWLQQQYWARHQEEREREREGQRKKHGAQETYDREQEREQRERWRTNRKEQESRRGGRRY